MFFKEHLDKFVAIAPVLSVKNLASPMVQDLSHDEEAIKKLKAIGPELFTNALQSNLIGEIVVESSVGSSISEELLSLMSDEVPAQIDPNGKANAFKFYPSGASFRQLDHFKQMCVSGEFKKYDFGSEEENVQRYGTPTPPHYDIKEIAGLNLCLVCGKKDLLSSSVDYTWLCEELSSSNHVTFKEYNLGHMGLLFPKDKASVSETL